jgi:hypothetical protein
MIRTLWLTALLIAGSRQQEPCGTDKVPVNAPPTTEGEFSIKRAAGGPPLVIRDDEVLTYSVEVAGFSVGEATFISRVERADAVSVGHLRAAFKASNLFYELDHRLHSQHMRSGEIKLKSSDTQRGSENRRREIRVECGEEGLTAVYRSDGHCKGCGDKAHFNKSRWFIPKHCKDCDKGEHRVWREPREREVPVDTLDFLSSIYLIRAFINAEKAEIETPLLDKDRLWNLSLKSGEAKDIEVPSGRYACRKILIDAEKPKSESHKGKFGGLFGMKGSMNFWVHESTGVMVQISGELPLGIDVDIRLKDMKGAPAGLAPKGS